MILNLSNKPVNFQGGNISNYLDKWEQLTNDNEILSTVSGLRINVVDPLPPSELVQHPFKGQHREFLLNEMNNLTTNAVIAETEHTRGEFISPIFLRPKSENSFRLILNLKSLNKHVPYEHFKMDTLNKILQLVRPNVFMAKIDIKDAYYSVSIHQDDTDLLKFSLYGKLYKFLALPNGYAEGPRKFTKLLKPPLAVLRSSGICVAAYIDDLITMNNSFNACLNNVFSIVNMIDSIGFTLNVHKSKLIPSQKIEFLGMIIDSTTMTVSLTQDKKLNIKAMAYAILLESRTKIRDIARFIGKLTSSLIAVPLGKLFYRHLDRLKCKALVQNQGNFDKFCYLDEYSKIELQWWVDNISEAIAPINRGNPIYTLTTDASMKGWGATYAGNKTGGHFDHEERESHINILEAKAVLFGLKSLCKHIANSHILVKTDNLSTKGALNNMGSSKSLALHFQIYEIWQWAISSNNWITATHIPGIENVEADTESFNQHWLLTLSLTFLPAELILKSPNFSHTDMTQNVLG